MICQERYGGFEFRVSNLNYSGYEEKLMMTPCRARHNPCETKAKQLCLEAANRRIASATTNEKVKHCAKHDRYDETFALLPSFLQSHASLAVYGE
jgi:hypothetical protein